jgi:biopolymer transport protein ExbD
MATDPVTSEPRLFSIPLPRPLRIAAATLLLTAVGCQGDSTIPSQSARPQAGKAPVHATKMLKVTVSTSGEISVDGHSVTLDQLAAELSELKQIGGEVWYHRENPAAAEPHPNAMSVIELVVKNQLPVRLSSKPDFSDFVDDKGVARTGTR